MKKYKRKENLVWEEVGDELIILDHEKGKVYTLNKTAKEIWECLVTNKTLDEVFDYMKNKYKNDDIIKEDIKEIIVKLSEEN